jgi:hypothetical protein
MSFAQDHADALRGVQDSEGVAVTFTPPPSSAASAVTGYAIRSKGNPAKYAALSLIESDSPTLFFVPSTFAVQASLLGYSVVWASDTYTVRDSAPIAPAGPWIAAKLIVSA